MTTSPMPFLYDINSGGAIPPEKQAYFEDRLRNRLYDLVLREFRKQQQEAGLTQKDVAARLGKRPEQINRWLSGPGNWTLDTISNLLLAICKGELSIGVSVLSEQPARNRREPEWLTAHPPEPKRVGTTAGHALFTATPVQPQHSPHTPARPHEVSFQRAEASSAGRLLKVEIKRGKNGRL